MGVIACKKDSLQVMLARQKELANQFTSVHYLHVIRCFNASVDTLALEALKAKSEEVVADSERLNELWKLNRIQEKLIVTQDRKETPTIATITRLGLDESYSLIN